MSAPAELAVVCAGAYPSALVEACARCHAAPGDLLAWSVRPDSVALVLPTGQKVTFAIRGAWQADPAARETFKASPRKAGAG